MKKITALLLLLVVMTVLPSCARVTAHSRSFFVMDTVVTVTLYSNDPSAAEAALALAQGHLEELDALWSRHRQNSEIARINTSATGCDGLDSRTVSLLKKAQAVHQATNGCFDITLAPVSDLWSQCASLNRLPTDKELSDALLKTGADRFSVTDTALTKPIGMELDLGGIGKGEAISSLIERLQGEAISGGLVSFGSNVAVFGQKPDGSPFRVALRDPKQTDNTVGRMILPSDTVLSVSGDYERFVTVNGERYHHILNPADGRPSQSGLSSVAVLCRDGGLADALSTALLVMGLEEAQAFYASGIYDFEAIFITSDGQILQTSSAVELIPD